MKFVSAAGQAIDERSDAELLRAIALTRDQEAFAQLYQRHERAAYSLARHMLRHGDAAEVAVQEAMLRIWRSAEKYRYDKNGAGWIMRIVAFECIRIQKVKRKETARTKPLPDEALAPASRAENSEPARDELLAGLRNSLESLPETNRQLVSLYFLGGLTQEEIGRELSLPQQTVSIRLRDTLAHLRAQLGKAGLAAAIPLLSQNDLGAALGQTFVPPATLKPGMIEGLSSAKAAHKVSHVLSRKTATASMTKPALIAGMVLLAASAGYFGLTTYQASGNRSGLQVTASPATTDGLRQMSWSLENGLPAEFQVLEGRWKKWAKKTADHPAGMVAPSEAKDAVVTVLPIEVRARPFVVRTHTFLVAENVKIDRVEDGLGVTQGGAVLGYTTGKVPVNRVKNFLRPLSRVSSIAEYYFVDRYVFTFRDGNMISVGVNDAPYPARYLYLRVFGYGVQSIEFRELHQNEILAVISDPDAAVAQVQECAESRKKGWRVFSLPDAIKP
jgi:RNA polymerase sigma-70 factor, ECF subfamily